MEEQQPSPKRRHEGHFEACPGDTPAAACWRLELHRLLSKIRPEKAYTFDSSVLGQGRPCNACWSKPARQLLNARDRDSSC